MTRKRKYSAEQIDFLRNHKGSYKEMREDFFARYGIELTESKLDHLAERYNFRHGHRSYPHTLNFFLQVQKKGADSRRHPVGAIRKERKRTVIKQSLTGKQSYKYENISRHAWEKVHGKTDRRKESIIALDGNPLNTNIDNLFKLNKGELAALSRRKLLFNNKELTLLGIKINKILMKANALKNGKKNKS